MIESRNRIFIVAFCLLSLGGVVAVCAALLPHATLSVAEATQASQAADMETFDTFDLGEDYGELTIFDLVGYYLDNPPAEQSTDPVVKKKHFGGC